VFGSFAQLVGATPTFSETGYTAGFPGTTGYIQFYTAQVPASGTITSVTTALANSTAGSIGDFHIGFYQPFTGTGSTVFIDFYAFTPTISYANQLQLETFTLSPSLSGLTANSLIYVCFSIPTGTATTLTHSGISGSQNGSLSFKFQVLGSFPVNYPTTVTYGQRVDLANSWLFTLQ
jgi:hypothetical protein